MVASPAEVLVRHPHAVLSHESAAREVGIELVDDSDVQRLTVPRNHSHVAEEGWRVRRCDVPVLVLPNGVRVTAHARTILDLAAVLPRDEGVAAGDSALRKKLVTVAVLADLAASTRGRGRREALAVTAMLDPKAGSVLESLFRVLVATAGLPAPRSQALIVDGRDEIARVDFCWRDARLVVELDGFAFHSDRVAYRRDRERMNAMEQAGWRVLRFTWEDVRSRPQYVIACLTRCLAAAA